MFDGQSLGLSLDGGTLNPVPPNASQEIQIVAINDIINRLNVMLKTNMYSDGEVKRMLIGYQRDGWGTGKDFGIKISMDGIDVASAKDDELLFSMDMESWKWFDPTTRKNHTMVGILPDSTGGIAVAKKGSNVSEAF